MKKLTKRNSLFLISAGMLVMASFKILSRFMELPDFAQGSFVGIGIGLVLSAIVSGNLRPKKQGKL